LPRGLAFLCHREECGDLGCEALTKKKSEIASQARNDKQGCHREGTICHREARSDLACRVLANRKDEIVSQARIFMSSRAQRGDLAFRVLASRKDEIVSQARIFLSSRAYILSSRGTWRSRLL
jgi:hypothetical protein